MIKNTILIQNFVKKIAIRIKILNRNFWKNKNSPLEGDPLNPLIPRWKKVLLKEILFSPILLFTFITYLNCDTDLDRV